jgi:hypothetical protein
MPVFGAAVAAAGATIVTVMLRTRRERLAVNVTRPLPARPPAGGRRYSRRSRP